MFKKILLALFILWVAGLGWFINQISGKIDIKPTAQLCDSIIVLTGGSDRIHRGFELLIENKGSTLFISGVGEGITKKSLIAAHGGSKEQQVQLEKMENLIVLGHMASDTRSNAQEVRDFIQTQHFKTIRLVTANYHMPRALLELTHRIPDTQIIAEPVLPEDFHREGWWYHAGTLRLIFSEYMKYLAIRLGI